MKGSSPGPRGSFHLGFGEYLAFAEQQRLTVRADIMLGALDVGRLDILGGRLIHAEMPGARGDAALRLLARLPRAELLLRGVAEKDLLEHTVQMPWAEVFGSPPQLDGEAERQVAESFELGHGYVSRGGRDQAAGGAVGPEPLATPSGVDGQRLARVRRTTEPYVKATRPVHHFDAPLAVESAMDPVQPDPPEPPPLDPFERLFRQATQAYVKRDYGAALGFYEQCAEMRPDDQRVRHNIARLKKRLEE